MAHVPYALASALLLLSSLGLPARADEEPLPASCGLHPVHVVNPGCVPALAEEELGYEQTLPDLLPDITDVYVDLTGVFDPETGTVVKANPRVYFDTLTVNVGTVPFDLLSDDPGSLADATVSQCTAWTTSLACRERRTVDGFVAKLSERDIRWENYAVYELRRLLADGTPDWSPGGLVGTSAPVSTCLVDSRQWSAAGLPVPTYLTCNGTHEGVSPGWANLYGAEVVGQQIALDGLTDGLFALVVVLDPLGQVLESDRANNRVAVTVELTVAGGISRIVSRSWS
jgi:hypothetical protein